MVLVIFIVGGASGLSINSSMPSFSAPPIAKKAEDLLARAEAVAARVESLVKGNQRLLTVNQKYAKSWLMHHSTSCLNACWRAQPF